MPPSEPERWFESSNGAAGYADYVPKEEFFRELHNSFLDSRDTFETKCLQQTDGQILSIDASHKVTNLVYVCATRATFAMCRWESAERRELQAGVPVKIGRAHV